MSTLYESEKTHQQMLPQSADAESASADNLKGKDETRRGLKGNPATVVQHGRAETAQDHLPVQHHSAEPDLLGKQEDRGLAAPPGVAVQQVLMLDMHRHPLMPCHPAGERKLLHAERARVHHLSSFVIRIVDKATEQSEVPGAEVGIDPGSKFTGVLIFPADDEYVRCGIFSIELEHQEHLNHKKIGQRATYRRGRRTENLRYCTPRWENRNPEACASCATNARHGSHYCQPCAGTRSFVDNSHSYARMASSLQHQVDSTILVVSRLCRWEPVRAICLELVCFDLQKMENPETTAARYQQGNLALYEAREYLIEKSGRRFAYCKASEVPLHIEHIFAKSRGVTERVPNLTLACNGYNKAKDSLSVQVFLARDPKRQARILAQAKAPLKDAVAADATRWALWALWQELAATELSAFTASGGRSRWNRSRFAVSKSHTLERFCVRQVAGIASYRGVAVAARAKGRRSYARTRPDAKGLPRLRLARTKPHHGFVTRDCVQALVQSGNLAGT
ncbi:MAG: RNA-guided endonuclease IscB [Acidimicrobiales bacterium]